MAIELQHPWPGLASLDRVHQRTWSRPGRPAELHPRCEVATRIGRSLTRDANRVPTRHTPEVDKEHPG
jgi:hypothetical protein